MPCHFFLRDRSQFGGQTRFFSKKRTSKLDAKSCSHGVRNLGGKYVPIVLSSYFLAIRASCRPIFLAGKRMFNGM